MKKLIFLALAILFIGPVFSQDFTKVVNAKLIHWYGLDFTKAKMIGSIGFTKPDIICNRYVHEKWNGLVFSEPEKYDIGKLTGGKEINIHLDYILKRNSLVIQDNLIINENYEITKSDVQEILNEYPDEDGLGLVFVIESFNKLNDTANIWVTFFDTKTKEIFKIQKYTSEPGGFGVLNYWLGGVYDTCKQLKKDYKQWEKGIS